MIILLAAAVGSCIGELRRPARRAAPKQTPAGIAAASAIAIGTGAILGQLLWHRIDLGVAFVFGVTAIQTMVPMAFARVRERPSERPTLPPHA